MSLDQSSLKGTLRTPGGKGPARRLRVTGQIPAVIYGHGKEPVSLTISPIELKSALATPHKFNTVITVKLDKGGDKIVLLKDYQHHPLTRALLHADFQELDLTKPVKVEVPVQLTGKAIGTADGGILTQIKRTIGIECLPGAIPAVLPVDVTGLKIGQSLHEDDLKLPEGIKLSGHKNETLATITIPDAEVAAPVAAAAVAAPGAAAAGAAGAKAGDAKAGDAKAGAKADAKGAKAAPAKK